MDDIAGTIALAPHQKTPKGCEAGLSVVDWRMTIPRSGPQHADRVAANTWSLAALFKKGCGDVLCELHQPCRQLKDVSVSFRKRPKVSLPLPRRRPEA